MDHFSNSICWTKNEQDEWNIDSKKEPKTEMDMAKMPSTVILESEENNQCYFACIATAGKVC